MPTPSAHAKLSASSAHRWLNCTAAPGFEQQFPRKTSEYAEEGTLAHEICEILGKNYFGQLGNEDALERMLALETHERYDREMLGTGQFYVDRLKEASLSYAAPPAVFFEVRVNLSEIIPEGFGTCDCCMIGGDTLRIFDYKHGKGVEVSAEGNPQMRLYALGALAKFRLIYGESIKKVVTAIIQPRITEDVSTEEMTVEELIAWGETVKPIAQKAFTGEGAEYHAGDWCRFCAGKAQCRARADGYTALEEFAALPKEPSNLLSAAEIADLLHRGAGLVKWYEDLQEHARAALISGREIPGWKIVEGRSTRQFSNQDDAIAALIGAGYPEATLYERKPLTLAQLEKVIGKKPFAELCGDLIVRPPGKPTLAPESDKRPPYSSAAIEAEGLK